MKKWKYEKEMAYVSPFITERKPQDSSDITSDDDLSLNADKKQVLENKCSEKEKTNIEADVWSSVSDVNSIGVSDEIPKDSQQKEYPISTVIKRKTVELEPSAVLIAKLLDNNKSDPRKLDEIDRFFLNISDTVKKFPAYEQALIKNKIFSLVSGIELQRLAPTSSTSYAFNSSPQSTSSSVMPIKTSSENWEDQTKIIQIKKE